jgi:hypothetical protein
MANVLTAAFSGLGGSMVFLVVSLCLLGWQLGELRTGTLAKRARAAEERAAFMEDCQRHRPGYECTVLWRGCDDRGLLR